MEILVVIWMIGNKIVEDYVQPRHKERRRGCKIAFVPCGYVRPIEDWSQNCHGLCAITPVGGDHKIVEDYV